MRLIVVECRRDESQRVYSRWVLTWVELRLRFFLLFNIFLYTLSVNYIGGFYKMLTIANPIDDFILNPLVQEFIVELKEKHFFDRLNIISQLGRLKVPKELRKTRYDYVKLQLYLHYIIDTNLSTTLAYSYNSKIRANEFDSSCKDLSNKEVSISCIIQLITIASNLGHFQNTFVSSKAMIHLIRENDAFKRMFLSSSSSNRFVQAVTTVIEERNHFHFHLLNSILLLEHCNQNLESVCIAKELLYIYLEEEHSTANTKILGAFELFRKVRDITYVSIDLNYLSTPFNMDLTNKNRIVQFLKENLSIYNNNEFSEALMVSMKKLLNDTIYNSEKTVIEQGSVEKKMIAKIQKSSFHNNSDYFNDYFLENNCILNKKIPSSTKFEERNILKITFSKEERKFGEKLYEELSKTEFVLVGYYIRPQGEITIIVTLNSSCKQKNKCNAAMNVLKIVVAQIRSAAKNNNEEKFTDKRFLLCGKFFLYHLFEELTINIKPSVSNDICAICTKGKKQRVEQLKKLLKSSNASKPVQHETAFMILQLENDDCGDVTLAIPASIVGRKKDNPREDFVEFDGIVIFPNRTNRQVLFLEAKYTAKNKNKGKKELEKKLNKIKLEHDENEILIDNHDAFMYYSVKKKS